MNRKLQFALIVLAFGAWNVASAQSTAPAKSAAKPVVAQAAPGMTVAQAPGALGGVSAGADATVLTGGVAGGGAAAAAGLGIAAGLGAVAQAATDSGTTTTHH